MKTSAARLGANVKLSEVWVKGGAVGTKLEKYCFGHTPGCMTKTQYSFTDDASKLGRPTGFNNTVRQVNISASAGFVVAVTGNIMKMPGLPKLQTAGRIEVGNTGRISGLF